MDEQTAAWLKYADPGEQHAWLGRTVGTWKAEARFWSKPGEPPQESDGKQTNTWLLGKRFVQSIYEGNTPWGEFTGMAIDGFDRQRGKYVGIWIDSMGTAMMVFEGKVEGDVRTMVAELINPMSGEPMKMRGVTTLVSEDEHRYESFLVSPQGEFKNMEIVYRRA